MQGQENIYDIAIIGGGINGAGIAADAAGRGLSVFLCEQHDFASGTSSSSSKLIHGGLRYLEHYEFRLVREALAEREVLLNKAPHLVSPLKFTLPHRPHLRPAWMIRCGLFLYDHLSRRNSLPKTKKVHFDADSPLQPNITAGFDYYDCWVDDSRLVMANVLDASRHGATIQVKSQCSLVNYDENAKAWKLTIKHSQSNAESCIFAKNIVNASGPWLNQFLETSVPNVKIPRRIRLIKGSHIIVPRTLDNEGAYILQNEDKRIVFVLPYLDNYTLIGTTDKEHLGAPGNVSIEDWEVDYLLNIYNQHFKTPLLKKDIVSSYSGVRPLCDDESNDPSAITRDYTLELHAHNSNSALLSIYGGKITTYRKLSEAALSSLSPYLPQAQHPWTKDSPLPGAAYLGQSLQEIEQQIRQHSPWLSPQLSQRFAKSYGLLCLEFLSSGNDESALGQDFGHGLRQAEVDYLIEQEWAQDADSILWRRSKLGLEFSADQALNLDAYVRQRISDINIRKASEHAHLKLVN